MNLFIYLYIILKDMKKNKIIFNLIIIIVKIIIVKINYIFNKNFLYC